MRLSVIMPVFNEEKTVLGAAKRCLARQECYELIIIDDCSTDTTRKKIKKINDKRVKIIFHEYNQGKGAAIKTGLKKVTGDYVIVNDADLEYDPDDWPKLIHPISDNKATVVYGSRFTGEHRNMFFWNWVANHFLSLLMDMLYDTTLSDMETCYKLIPTDLLRSLNLRANRFDFEPEVTSKILKRGIRIYEVPISYAGREYSEGKKINWTDGLHALWTILKFRFFD